MSARRGEEDRRGATLLYVIGSLDLGGAERHLAEIAPRLKGLGWRPSIYCLGRRGAQADGVQGSGVEVIGPPVELSLASGGRPIKAAGLALSALKLAATMATRRPAIVHFFLPAAYVIGGPLALLARIPIRIMSRRSLNVYQDTHPLARRLEPHIHKRMTAILGNSQRVTRQLIDEEGCVSEHVNLIYNGVDIGRFRPSPSRSRLRERLGLDVNAFVMTIIANLIAYKGHADLLAALARIAPDLPQPWTLQCIGRDEGLMSDLVQLADTLGLGERVTFLGEQRDVEARLAASDLGVLASHQEGFSNAILECMASGLPMVVSDVGGNAEAVVDGETGIVVPAHDPAALGRAIGEIAQNSELAGKMGVAARKRAKKRFSIESCVTAYDDFYRKFGQSMS